MADKAISIDHAANGLLRHRFVRAIGASWMVLMVAGCIATVLISVVMTGLTDQTSRVTDVASFLVLLIGGIVVFVPVLFVALLFAAIMGFLFDALHRRVLALLALLITVPVTVFAIAGVLQGALMIVGRAEPTLAPDGQPLAMWQVWAVTVLMVVSVIIAAESAGWAWWQMTTSRAGFLAARGWRPPPWRLFSSLRRHLGLPAYISNFGRGRFGLTLIYFLAAVVNIGLVALTLVPTLLLGIDRGADLAGELAIAASFGGLFVLNLLGVGVLIDRWGDRVATKLYQKARDWDGRPPIVFLRDFDQDDAKLPARAHDPFVKIPAGVGGARTMDEILLENGSAYGPVIAIGDPRDPTPPLGAARVFVEGQGTEWQDVVRQLMGASKAVVMSPSDSAGVQWELDLVAGAGGRIRVIFLANPELTPEANTTLFAKLAPNGETREMKKKHSPVAAYGDPEKGWRVLSTARRPCVQTYTAALNYALQDLLGLEGVPLKRAKRKPA